MVVGVWVDFWKRRANMHTVHGQAPAPRPTGGSRGVQKKFLHFF